MDFLVCLGEGGLRLGEPECGLYPIHGPVRLTINRNKRVDFRALENLSPMRNGFVWSRHLLFIFIF